MASPHVAKGELRIYFGAAPGVGKTYAMLNEGRRRQERGTHVVAGWINARHRPATEAQIEGLRIIPPLYINKPCGNLGAHRGTEGRMGSMSTENHVDDHAQQGQDSYLYSSHDGIGEAMDVLAILEESPKVVLVDDLADANPSGCERVSRWQDVEVLLESGIDVISTLNVDRLESLADMVFKITGTVPDSLIPDKVVRAADQVELIDMTPQALVRRLAHGNIFPAEDIDISLAGYFRPTRLAALRELALLWVADRVDEYVRRYAEGDSFYGGFQGKERVVVAVTGASGGDRLIRRAARMASRSNGELVAVHVSRDDGVKSRSMDRLESFKELTIRLGGSYHEIAGSNVSSALVNFVRVQRATRLVLGASRRSRISEALFGSVINDLIRNCAGEVDVMVISPGSGDDDSRHPAIDKEGRRHPSTTGDTHRRLSKRPFFSLTRHPSTLPDVSEQVKILDGALAIVLDNDDPVPSAMWLFRNTLPIRGVSVVVEDGGGYESAARWGDAPNSPDSSSVAIPIGKSRYVCLAADRVDDSVQPFLHAMCTLLGLAVEKRDRVLDRSKMKLVEEGDKFRSALLSSVSHDLRTPLASIKAAATSLLGLGTLGNPEIAKELLLTIDTETDRLDMLVSNLLDMSRLQTGSINVDVMPVALEDILPGVMDYLKDDSGRVEFRVSSNAQGIMADPVLLERVIANLLQNALSYSGQDSKVLLEAGVSGGEGYIRVVDFGPGIVPKKRDEVFRPFQRLSDVPNGTGVGLGLAVVRGFVESMHGVVSLHDTPGGGCTVEIVLPVSEELLQSEHTSTSREAVSQPRESRDTTLARRQAAVE